MDQAGITWEEIAAIERVSVRTAKRAAREWQQFLDRCEGADAPLPNSGMLAPRLRDGGGFMGLGTPLDPREAAFEQELLSDSRARFRAR